MWGPMAIAVIIGILFATFLTLILVPVLYSAVEDVSSAGKKSPTSFPFFGQVCGGVLPHLLSWRACGRHHPTTDASTRNRRPSRPWFNASPMLCIP